MDALILELIKEKIDNMRQEVQALIEAHSNNPDAHPHAHDMDVSAAVEEHLSTAAAEIEAAIQAEVPSQEPAAPEEQPLPPPEPPREELEPKREHVLHRRIG